MARQAPPAIGRPTPIQPVATPVSTYVRPAEPAPSSLHQLAKGLAAFDTGMKGWLQKKEAEQAEADAIRGEAAFNSNNQVGWAQGVASGAIPAHASPVFMESYKRAEGNRMGIQMRAHFQQEYAQWEGRNSEDPEAFQTFLSDFITRHTTTDDTAILAGLNPHVEALADSAFSTWSTDRANTAYNGSLNTRAAIVGDIIDFASQQGIALETGTNYEAMRADILAQREEALSSGLRMADFDKELVGTIAAKAIEHGDPQLLQLLEDTLPGYDVALSSLPDFRDVKATTETALVAAYRRSQDDMAKRQQAEDKAMENRIVTGVMRGLYENPMADIPEEVLREWEKYDPEARKKLVDARKSLTDGLTMEDPQDLITIERMIQAGATIDDIFALASDGVVKDPATLRTLMDRVQQRQEAGAGILGTQTARRYLFTIKERTAPPFNGLFAPDGLTDEGIEATRDFENMLIEWTQANPTATTIEREKFINEAAELILKRIDRTNLQAPQYQSREDLERLAAEDEAARQETLEGFTGLAEELAAPGPAPQPLGAPQGLASALSPAAELGRYVGANVTKPGYASETAEMYGADAPPALSEMDETSRQIIEQQAETLGMTPEEFNLELWKTMREDLGLSTEYTPPAPAAPPEQSQANPDLSPTSGKTYSTAPEVQQVSSILDLIGNTEGTDKRLGYNETLAYGKLTGGDVNLTSMTLDQIDALQGQMLRHPENKWNSSALGRYQIIRTTLRGLKDELGLSGNEKFTPELQDRLALHLLERRGLSRWASGQLSDDAFLANLSAEWASLPKADGTGTYEGQRIGTDANGVLMALAPIKQGPQSSALQAIEQVTSERNIDAYRNMPEAERDQFLQWNSDPIGNHEKHLAEAPPELASVVRRAQEIAGVQFVVGSGKRDEELQRKAVEWGWSKTMDSDHVQGGALDLWPIIDGAVEFDKDAQMEIVRAMRQAAEELGVELDIGADWKSFKDLPHFALKSA